MTGLFRRPERRRTRGNIRGRDDLDVGKRVVWAIVGIVWGVGPIPYVTVGDGALW